MPQSRRASGRSHWRPVGPGAGSCAGPGRLPFARSTTLPRLAWLTVGHGDEGAAEPVQVSGQVCGEVLSDGVIVGSVRDVPVRRGIPLFGGHDVGDTEQIRVI